MEHLVFTDENFKEEVKDHKGIVVVDMWAPWCMPCQMLGPVIEELAEEMSKSAKIGKMNVDDNPNTAAEFGIMSIPSVLVFKDGELVESLVGIKPKQVYIDVINQYSE